MLKTISSLQPNEKFKSIGQAKAKEIIKGIRNYSYKIKLKPVAADLGTKRVSLLKLVKTVSKNQGRVVADKLIREAQKNLNKGVNPDIQKGFMKANMQRDLPDRQERRMTFAGGGVVSRTIGGARTKGTMGDIGVKKGTNTFAQNLNKAESPGSSSPQASLKGSRPLGL